MPCKNDCMCETIASCDYNCFYLEIELRQRKLLIHPETLILCVVDPKPNIGSGGATLNAVLHVTEHISALQGYTVR